jgi:hypothetical protein
MHALSSLPVAFSCLYAGLNRNSSLYYAFNEDGHDDSRMENTGALLWQWAYIATSVSICMLVNLLVQCCKNVYIQTDVPLAHRTIDIRQ